jgi:ferrochelatase
VTAGAILYVSFGGPEAPGEVMPFLERVTGGRVPRERLDAVAGHYLHFGGRSPINAENHAVADALRARLPGTPVYEGNRFAPPFLPDVLAAMRDDGIRHAHAFVTSAFGSAPSCRAYTDDLARARAEVGDGAPVVEKLARFGEHPRFLDGWAKSLARAGADAVTPVLFTAHSIPLAMAAASPYEREIRAACEAVAARAGLGHFELAWQSRSGPPDAWLGPDVFERLRALAAGGASRVVVAPIGFFSDHMEVVWDLDVEARRVATEAGLAFARAETPARDPAATAEMIADLVAAGPVACAPGCCAITAR